MTELRLSRGSNEGSARLVYIPTITQQRHLTPGKNIQEVQSSEHVFDIPATRGRHRRETSAESGVKQHVQGLGRIKDCASLTIERSNEEP